jgi:hypothetical protein
MSDTNIAICRQIAARYRELAKRSALPLSRDGFERLAASYDAIATRLEAAENASAAHVPIDTPKDAP